MNERLEKMRKFFVVDKKQKEIRQENNDEYLLAKEFEKNNTKAIVRSTESLLYMLNNEQPVIFGDERIAFVRTIQNVPRIYTENEIEELKKTHWIHERGDVCNICVDYNILLKTGIIPKIEELIEVKKIYDYTDAEKSEYIGLQIKILEAILTLTEKYKNLAEKEGNMLVAKTLSKVPARRPETFIEALQMFRILHYVMWCAGSYHNVIGRFDQLMMPYLAEDIKNGIHDKESAIDLLEEFFLTFNRDSDLYPGMQQGDNGQSIVLGGLNPDGTDSYNLLSELCLIASLNLRLIDPKINLRVNKNTPIETYILGTKLTERGLGFPQYSNDDVVIKGLIDLGYSEKDAYNYVCAACWEFIIPRVAMDIPNISALSFNKVVDIAVKNNLESCNSYEEFEEKVNIVMATEIQRLVKEVENVYIFPSPFLSLMMENYKGDSIDISKGNKYNNYGIHGTGIASAADSMCAIKKHIFEDKTINKQELLYALDTNFVENEELCITLRYKTPKMGNNDDYVDQIAVKLLDYFADELKKYKNDRGGIFRPGTGSAMYYIWHTKEMSASADGRKVGEGLGCNFSPSLYSKCNGPVSIIQSFTKPNLERVINGGPLTLELHNSLFRNDESIKKVAMLVKSFMELGGHQLQLNAVNRETMIEAQKKPNEFKHLIVRVWGWSGYFVELDKEYQDHIIERMELIV